MRTSDVLLHGAIALFLWGSIWSDCDQSWTLIEGSKKSHISAHLWGKSSIEYGIHSGVGRRGGGEERERQLVLAVGAGDTHSETSLATIGAIVILQGTHHFIVGVGDREGAGQRASGGHGEDEGRGKGKGKGEDEDEMKDGGRGEEENRRGSETLSRLRNELKAGIGMHALGEEERVRVEE
jgi:hypothetical protein